MSNIIEGITKDLTEIPKNLKAKAGGMDTKSWESIPPESYVIYINLPVPVLHRQSDLQYSQFQD